jgi:hypothetical protein
LETSLLAFKSVELMVAKPKAEEVIGLGKLLL